MKQSLVDGLIKSMDSRVNALCGDRCGRLVHQVLRQAILVEK